MRRLPLWLTLVPLIIGIAVYWHLWSGYRDTLRADIARFVPGDIAIGGFPYRMEATVPAPVLVRPEPLVLSLKAERAVVNRGPWQRDLTVVRTVQPRVGFAVPLAGASATIAAASAISSVHLAGGRVVRQSNVFTAARVSLGLFAAPWTAATLEVHLRELAGRSNEAWSPHPPPQAQVVLAATGVRLGRGPLLTLAGDIAVTAASRLRDYAGWLDGGTVEINRLTLSDATGEIVRLSATAVPVAGRLRLTGTIDTVCPAMVAAAFAGTTMPAEFRARTAVRLAFDGTVGSFRLTTAAAGPHPVRAQAPPCPALG